MLNGIWAALVLVSLVAGLWQWAWLDQSQLPGQMANALINSGKTSVDIAIGLVGMLCLWLGLMRIAEDAGLTARLARLLSPLLCRILPGVPKDHPALGACTMNIAANMLGLDNAATPLGLKAMTELQRLNPKPDTASDAQIVFLVINTASVTLLPLGIIAYRAQAGAANPADVALPLLLASYSATLGALLLSLWVLGQRLRDPVLWAYLGGGALALVGLAWSLLRLPAAQLQPLVGQLGNLMLLVAVGGIVALGLWRRVPVYDSFITGAKEGFDLAVRLIPYLVAMLLAVALLRESGILGGVLGAVRYLVAALGFDTQWVEALPTGILKSLSGGAARASLLDVLHTQGADSFVGRLVSVIAGSSETTLYVLSVYFGAVGIHKVRSALALGLAADLLGFIAAVAVSYALFG